MASSSSWESDIATRARSPCRSTVQPTRRPAGMVTWRKCSTCSAPESSSRSAAEELPSADEPDDEPAVPADASAGPAQEPLEPDPLAAARLVAGPPAAPGRSEEHTSELQSRFELVCRLLLEKKKMTRLVNNSAFAGHEEEN